MTVRQRASVKSSTAETLWRLFLHSGLISLVSLYMSNMRTDTIGQLKTFDKYAYVYMYYNQNLHFKSITVSLYQIADDDMEALSRRACKYFVSCNQLPRPKSNGTDLSQKVVRQHNLSKYNFWKAAGFSSKADSKELNLFKLCLSLYFLHVYSV